MNIQELMRMKKAINPMIEKKIKYLLVLVASNIAEKL